MMNVDSWREEDDLDAVSNNAFMTKMGKGRGSPLQNDWDTVMATEAPVTCKTLR